MTILEKITRDPSWRGCAVEPAMHNGRPAWKITRDNAVAFVYKEAAQVQVRHWDAYIAAVDARCALQNDAKGVNDTWRLSRMSKMQRSAGAKRAWCAIDHFAALSGYVLVTREVRS